MVVVCKIEKKLCTVELRINKELLRGRRYGFVEFKKEKTKRNLTVADMEPVVPGRMTDS